MPSLRRFAAPLVVGVALLTSCGTHESEAARAAPELSREVDGVLWEAGNWEPHLAAGAEGASWGNHRAVVEVADVDVPAVVASIPWRRRDADPAAKGVIVVSATTGERVRNVLALDVLSESGRVAFEPVSGSPTYHVYYLPWSSTGGYYPTIVHLGQEDTADPEWESAVLERSDALPGATTTHIQSVNDFHSFFPMEVVATESERADFWSGVADGWRLIAEHRDRPIRMRRAIPRHWTLPEAAASVFSGQALRDEYFTFQVAVVTNGTALSDVQVEFEGFAPRWLETLTCFNCGGIDRTGEPFTKRVDVADGAVQPLWIGVRVPADQAAGTVEGTVTVRPSGLPAKTVAVSIDVQPGIATQAGYDQPETMARLEWLNSTVGTDPDFLIDPYVPVQVEAHTLSILGRRVSLGTNGLPEAIESAFAPDLSKVGDTYDPVTVGGMDLVVQTAGSEVARFVDRAFTVETAGRGRAEWTVDRSTDDLAMRVEGALEYDGMLDYRITLRATSDIELDDVSLTVSMPEAGASYMLGLGRRGGFRPDELEWTWQVENHQEGVWLGSPSRGLQWVLRDDGYVRPLNTNFYQNQPLRLPESWYNQGNGGIRIETADGVVTARNYSGARTMAAGDSLQFNVRFLITPFKPIDTGEHFRTRFVHKYVPVDSVKAWGGTVVNIHHANEINPYINYPFFNLDQQTAYITEAHAKGIKVKLYNTIRELTYRAHELFALRSLGDEILNDGEGGGHSWMQEHLEADYHSAWHAWRVDDAAMLNKGTSRWTNYYIEGLNWLAANQHIDGLYLDDIAFSRETVKRMISVLHEHRDEVVIDLHSANQFNPRDGHINSAFLYMEHFPFISRLWFGEYFEYDRGPEYWMTEVAGIPFGLMGEMLQDGGHPYRGLLYGMTARLYGDVDPRPVWALMNGFGIADSRMQGYWLDDAPVTTGREDVLATTYAREDGVLIALASWSDQDETVTVDVDWAALGMSADAEATAPAVAGLQAGSSVDLQALTVPANQGLFVLLRPAR